jgi:NAD(P)H-dependent FMN reductase
VSKPTLQVIVGSTRPGRIGLPIAEWVVGEATADGHVAVELIDLAEVDLPLFDEPDHPMLGTYTHDHTKAWSATVARADAFVFVMPEYNHSFNAALKNAIDFLFTEWQHKPVGFVSYGGIAGGTRAVAMMKPVVSALKMIPLVEGVPLPFVHTLMSDGAFQAADVHRKAAKRMLVELARTAALLAPVRAELARA